MKRLRQTDKLPDCQNFKTNCGRVVTVCVSKMAPSASGRLCLTLLACASARQPVRQQHPRQPTQDASGGTLLRGGGPAAHRRLAAENAVRVFVYPPPIAPFRRSYTWRFEPLIADLTEMGFVTRNMSEADVLTPTLTLA